MQSSYDGKSPRERKDGFRDFMFSILPPPPDRRQVVLANGSMESLHSNHGEVADSTTENANSAKQGNSKIRISRENTTIIGDYSSLCFPEYHEKWAVQAQGNAMLTSTLVLIKEKLLDVNKR